MSTRAAAAEATRERIIEAALLAFTSEWYDDVTLRGIAADAGVALQTLVNHFGTKGGVVRRRGRALRRRPSSPLARPYAGDDIPGAITTLVDDYERERRRDRSDARTRGSDCGSPTRARARASRARAVGRTGLRRRARATSGARNERGGSRELVAATDVYTWKLLRRDKGLTRKQTILAVREMVEALHNDAKGGSG